MGAVRSSHVSSLLNHLHRLNLISTGPSPPTKIHTSLSEPQCYFSRNRRHPSQTCAHTQSMIVRQRERINGGNGITQRRPFTHTRQEHTESYTTRGGSGRKRQSNRMEEDRSYKENVAIQKIVALRAAMAHVMGDVQTRLGWTEVALRAGARDAGLSPAIVGAFPHKDAALVEYFMDECNHRLTNELEAREKQLSSMLLAARIATIVRLRLEMQAPYVSKWAQALSIQANPMNLATGLKQRAILMDEIWHAAGDQSTDMDWYTKRAFLGSIYTASELYMLTDFSPGLIHGECLGGFSAFCDTWTFLDRRIRNLIDSRKTAQEASQVAKAVSLGFQNTLKSMFNRKPSTSSRI